MFFSKKEDISLINMENKISILKTRVDNLELTIEMLKNHITSIRGLINRKFSTPRDDEEYEEEEGKDINNPVILPENGVIRKHRKSSI